MNKSPLKKKLKVNYAYIRNEEGLKRGLEILVKDFEERKNLIIPKENEKTKSG